MRSSKRSFGSRRGGQGHHQNHGRDFDNGNKRNTNEEDASNSERDDKQWQRTSENVRRRGGWEGRGGHGSQGNRGGRGGHARKKPLSEGSQKGRSFASLILYKKGPSGRMSPLLKRFSRDTTPPVELPKIVWEEDSSSKMLETKSTASTRDAAMFCNQESFQDLLNDGYLGDDWVDLMLTIINKALVADDSISSFKEELKSSLLQEPLLFLSKTCIQRFTKELVSSCLKIDPLLRALQNYLDIFHRLCAMDPLVSKSLIVQVKTVKQLMKAEVHENDQLKGIFDLYSQATVEIERQEKEREEREKRMKEMERTGRVVLNEKPLGDFREISVYPTEEDLQGGVELRPNCTDKAFESVDDYLDIQFRLLREDFVSTLRLGIQEFKKNPNLQGPNCFRSGDVKIYENLEVSSPYFGQNGLVYVAKLNTKSPMFQRMNWLSSKRLIYGSLLCLSQDNFDKVNLFAVISERKNKTISTDGEFEIEFLPDSQAAYDELTSKNTPFIAVESTAYFEAYKHVLRGIQKLSDSNFAFAKYIIRVETSISSPTYTRFIETFYRFITAANDVTPPVSIFQEGEGKWPPLNQLGFNESQYEAYKMALTKEFAVIQGPPGTGKTFVGLRIAETLLYNLYGVPCTVAASKHARQFEEGSSFERELLCPDRVLNQMLIVCYTNHALDQFLEGMLYFCPLKYMIRVGSRSKNEVLGQCNLKYRKEWFTGQLGITYSQTKRKLDRFIEEQSINKINREMKHSKTHFFLYEHPGLFEDFPEFFEQIQDYADDLEDKRIAGDAMYHWLKVALRKSINSSGILSDERVEDLKGLAAAGKLNITVDLSVDDRWKLYRHIVAQYRNYMVPALKSHQENYRRLLDAQAELRMQQEIDAMKKVRVIGMTTTGAARLQLALQEVRPEIVLVEEAAEVLEAHIVTALSKHCKHLILIGDHKQLKPNPTVYDLALKYHLDLSLFERMVNNGLPVSTLNIQHRMRPEISKYIRGHIYDRLDDHQSVLDRDPVEGMKSPVYLFNHNNPEKSDEGTISKMNEFEALMVVGLTRYLLRQESYKPEDVTIITMYTGQLLLIKGQMPKHEFNGVKITSVDNFQGEENKIVIISLVRSNPEKKLGFVKIKNRVCVSLSRAQYGMYVFGNFDMLSAGSSLWRNIVEEATKVNELGTSLLLSCQIHKNLAIIETPEDFRKKAPTGGCQLKCNTTLECGHICKMKCHSKDWKHEKYQCTEPCTKLLSPCNHSCPGQIVNHIMDKSEENGHDFSDFESESSSDDCDDRSFQMLAAMYKEL
ncbi:NFX1-type zinc finger-containing protein 1-like [Watersipora subatra]|uniref:NFX1-type zinc finger-containing protein 1-like n=1 Tax=Watersipora subatra TaxID=2589382 RepID=UPI00355C8F34